MTTIVRTPPTGTTIVRCSPETSHVVTVGGATGPRGPRGHGSFATLSDVRLWDTAVEGDVPVVDVDGFLVPGQGGTGTGVTDGDKGDVIVSGTGTVWTVENHVRNVDGSHTGVLELDPAAGETIIARTADGRGAIAYYNNSLYFIADHTAIADNVAPDSLGYFLVAAAPDSPPGGHWVELHGAPSPDPVWAGVDDHGLYAGDPVHPSGLYVLDEIDDRQLLSEKGAADGYASLDPTGKVPNAQLPPIAITEVYAVASEAAMLALPAQRGDIAIRTDENKTYVLSTDDPTVLADWLEILSPAGGTVASVDGRTGVVTLNDLYDPLGAAAAVDADKVDKAGDTMTGPLVLDDTPEADLEAAPRVYADGGARMAAQRVLAKIAQGIDDVNIVIWGDSISVDWTDAIPLLVVSNWYDRVTDYIFAEYPTHTIVHHWYDATSNTYATSTTRHTGSGSRTVHLWLAAVSGTRTDYWTGHRMSAALLTPDPDLLIVAHSHNEGTTDTENDQSLLLSRYAACVDTVTRLVPKAFVMVLPMNVSTVATDRQIYKSRLFSEFAGNRGFGYVDTIRATIDNGGTALTWDGVHLHEQGMEVVGAAVKWAFADHGYQSSPTGSSPSLERTTLGTALKNAAFGEYMSNVRATAIVGSTATNTTLTATTGTFSYLDAGAPVTGTNIPANTIITAVSQSGATATISQATTGTGSGITFTIGRGAPHEWSTVDAAFTCTTTSGSPTVVATVGTFTQYDIGMPIRGSGIPAGAYVTAISGGGFASATITISANATASASGVAVRVGFSTTVTKSTTFHDRKPYSVRLQGLTSAPSGMRQTPVNAEAFVPEDIAAYQGRYVTFAAYLYVPSTSTTAGAATLRITDGINVVSQAANTTGPFDRWAWRTVTMKVDAAATILSVMVFGDTANNASADIYVDRCVLVGGREVVDSALDGSFDAKRVDARTVVVHPTAGGKLLTGGPISNVFGLTFGWPLSMEWHGGQGPTIFPNAARVDGYAGTGYMDGYDASAASWWPIKTSATAYTIGLTTDTATLNPLTSLGQDPTADAHIANLKTVKDSPRDATTFSATSLSVSTGGLYVFTGSSGSSATLPSVASNTDMWVGFMNRGTARLYVTRASSDVITTEWGESAQVLVPPGGWLELVSDGSKWVVTAGKYLGGVNTGSPAPATPQLTFGHAASGDTTIAGSSSLSADGHYGTLIVSGTLTVGGWRLFCRRLVGAGSVNSNGGDGAAGGAAGSSGGANFVGLANPGGAGGTAAGSNGTNIPNNAGVGAIGGNGGLGASGAGGTAGTYSAIQATNNGTNDASLLETNYLRGGRLIQDGGTTRAFAGGSGGGGGGGDGTAGGGGGGGGGVCLVFAFDASEWTGTVSANGGNGGSPAAGNRGGGGGGGGGLAAFIYGWPPSGSYTVSAAKGTGGTKTGTGVNGSDGTIGKTIDRRIGI